MATFKQYNKKDGTKAWLFKAYLGLDSATGKQITTTRRGFKTKKEASLELNRLKVEFKDNGLKKVAAVSTFKEVYELWFASYSETVKESTSIGTARYMENHVLPVFGAIKANKITLKMAQNAVNDWAKKLQVYKVVLQYVIKIMNYAIDLEQATNNPFTKVIRPKPKESENDDKLKFYTVEEIEMVMKVLEERVKNTKVTNRLYRYFAEFDLIFYRLLAFSGLRGGEALALTWKDIDFTSSTLTVNKTLSQTKDGFKVSSPKNKSSNRVISLDAKTIRLLKRWQLREKELLFSNRITHCEIVFPNLSGNYLNRQNIYMRSQRVAKFAGLPGIGTHGWRHSHASMLFEAGISMKEAQERLGHSSIEMTMNIYTHLSSKVKEETATKLAKFAAF